MAATPNSAANQALLLEKPHKLRGAKIIRPICDTLDASFAGLIPHDHRV